MINLIYCLIVWSFLSLFSEALLFEICSFEIENGKLEEKKYKHTPILSAVIGKEPFDITNTEEITAINKKGLENIIDNNELIDKVSVRNEHLIQQRKLIIGGSGVLFLILSFLYIKQIRRSKKECLKLNEEISRLLRLQQEKLEQGRNIEKERISKDLHDGVLGNLFGVRFMLSNLNDRTDVHSIQIKKRYLDDLKSIEEEIRNISHDIRPHSLVSEKSFVQLVRDFLEEQKNIYGFEYFLQEDRQINWEEIGEHTRLNLFRIIQEATHNTAKYSTATRISIIFKGVGGNIQMLIKDNGHGFDVHRISKGIGLKNIEARVNNLEGKMALSSSRKGTRIKVGVPSKLEDIYG